MLYQRRTRDTADFVWPAFVPPGALSRNTLCHRPHQLGWPVENNCLGQGPSFIQPALGAHNPHELGFGVEVGEGAGAVDGQGHEAI